MNCNDKQNVNVNPNTYVGLVEENGEKGCSCSEAILVTYGKLFGLDPDLAMKVAGGFGGGMGLMGETCGAVTAAFMVLGLAFGTADTRDSFSRQNTYLMVAEFAERFKTKQGSLFCRELCAGYSMSTAEGAGALRASGKPRQMIRAAAEILEQMLREEALPGNRTP